MEGMGWPSTWGKAGKESFAPAVRSGVAARRQDNPEGQFPHQKTVKGKLYHPRGLDDFDFITYFETEKLEDFHSLIRALEQVKEFRHNRRVGHPTLLGTVRPLDDILELFAR